MKKRRWIGACLPVFFVQALYAATPRPVPDIRALKPAPQLAWEVVATRESAKHESEYAWVAFASVSDAAKEHPDWSPAQLAAFANDSIKSTQILVTTFDAGMDVASVLPYHGDKAVKWGLEFSKYLQVNRDLWSTNLGTPSVPFATVKVDMWSDFYQQGQRNNKLLPAFDSVSQAFFHTTMSGDQTQILQPYPELQNNALLHQVLDKLDKKKVDEAYFHETSKRWFEEQGKKLAELKAHLATLPASAPTNTTPSAPAPTEKSIRNSAAEYQSEIATVAALGQLFSDPKIRRVASDFSVVAGAGVKAWESLALYDAGAIGATAATAGVVGAGVAIASLFAQSKDSAVTGQLQEISRQIAELYKEMERRFDIIDLNLAAEYKLTSAAYSAILQTNRNVEQARVDIDKAQEELFSIREGMNESFLNLERMTLRLATAPCRHFRYMKDSVSIGEINECVSKYIFGAVAKQNTTLLNLTPSALRNAFQGRPISDVVSNAVIFARLSGFRKVDASEPDPLPLSSAAAWQEGAGDFLDFSTSFSTEYISATEGWVNDYAQLKVPGVALVNALATLTGTTAEARKAFYEKLLAFYQQSVDALETEIRDEQDAYFMTKAADTANATEIVATAGQPIPSGACPPWTAGVGAEVRFDNTGWSQAGFSDTGTKLVPAGVGGPFVATDLINQFPIFKNRGGKKLDGSYLLEPIHFCWDATKTVTRHTNSLFGSFARIVQTVSVWSGDEKITSFTIDPGKEIPTDLTPGVGQAASPYGLWKAGYGPLYFAQMGSEVNKMQQFIAQHMRADPSFRAASMLDLRRSLRMGGALKAAMEDVDVRLAVVRDFVQLNLPRTALDEKVRALLSGTTRVSLPDLLYVSYVFGCGDVLCESGTFSENELYKAALQSSPADVIATRAKSLREVLGPLVASGVTREQRSPSLLNTLAGLDAFCVYQALKRSPKVPTKKVCH